MKNNKEIKYFINGLQEDVKFYIERLKLIEDYFWSNNKLYDHHDSHVHMPAAPFKGVPVFSGSGPQMKKRIKFPSLAKPEDIEKLKELDSLIYKTYNNIKKQELQKQYDLLENEMYEDSVDEYEYRANLFMNDTDVLTSSFNVESGTVGWKCSYYKGRNTDYVFVKFRQTIIEEINKSNKFVEFVMYEPVWNKEKTLITDRKIISYGLTTKDFYRESFPFAEELPEQERKKALLTSKEAVNKLNTDTIEDPENGK